MLLQKFGTMNNSNLIVIIPSYNEARTIGSIARDVIGMGFTVLVIDDGSIDNTKGEALENGALVIKNKENLGKGGSMRRAIDHVLGKMNFEWMVLMDGDGQHHPEDINSLIKAAEENPEAGVVVGNRMDNASNMPRDRYLTNKFMSWIISLMCGQKVPDTQCGYRLIKSDVFKKITLTKTCHFSTDISRWRNL